MVKLTVRAAGRRGQRAREMDEEGRTECPEVESGEGLGRESECFPALPRELLAGNVRARRSERDVLD